jgi:hypothetical protein
MNQKEAVKLNKENVGTRLETIGNNVCLTIHYLTCMI